MRTVGPPPRRAHRRARSGGAADPHHHLRRARGHKEIGPLRCHRHRSGAPACGPTSPVGSSRQPSRRTQRSGSTAPARNPARRATSVTAPRLRPARRSGRSLTRRPPTRARPAAGSRGPYRRSRRARPGMTAVFRPRWVDQVSRLPWITRVGRSSSASSADREPSWRTTASDARPLRGRSSGCRQRMPGLGWRRRRAIRASSRRRGGRPPGGRCRPPVRVQAAPAERPGPPPSSRRSRLTGPDITDVSDSTRSAWLIANRWTIMPPIEHP